MRRVLQSTLYAFCMGLLGTSLLAQEANVDGAFSLQGRLTTGTSNEAVADGQHSLTINVFEAGTNTVVATETDVVTTIGGVFSTMIGDNSDLDVEAGMDYEIGIAIDGGAELSPRIMIGEVPSAMTADLAAHAEALVGFTIGTGDSVGPNMIVTTDAQGRIDADLLGSSVVTSINGETGNINLNVTGSGVTFENDGNGNLNLNISGGTGSFELPFVGTANVTDGQSAFRLTSTGEGSAATFLNSGGGSALNLMANGSGSAALDIVNNSGSAISATGSAGADAVLRLQTTGSGDSTALITAMDAIGGTVFHVAGSGRTMIDANTGTALEVTTTAAGDAAIHVRNMATDSTAALISGVNAAGNTTFEVMGNGRTVINATVDNALDVSTSLAGGTALRVDGGLELLQAAGTGVLNAGDTAVTIDNPLVDANSIIMLTVNSSSSLTNGIRLSGQGEGSFTVSLLDTALGVLSGNVRFNYLIINR